MLTSLEEMGARKKETREGDTRPVISRILVSSACNAGQKRVSVGDRRLSAAILLRCVL